MAIDKREVTKLRVDFLLGKIGKNNLLSKLQHLTPDGMTAMPFFLGIPLHNTYFDETGNALSRQRAFLVVHSSGDIAKAINAGVKFIPHGGAFKLGDKRAVDYKELIK